MQRHRLGGGSEVSAMGTPGAPTAADFDEAVARHRSELLAHCYRMLGSPHDAEDALQEALVGAWQGWAGFAGRSSLRTWLFRIATNACLKELSRRPRRVESADLGPAFEQTADLGALDVEHRFVEPWPYVPAAGDPEAAYERRERVELAYVAALQHLPATQRAVLLLREVLQLSAAEVAEVLDTSVAAVNSALQRARSAVAERVPAPSQQAELAALGDAAVERLVAEFVAAWEAADVRRLTGLLTADVRMTMPPLRAWFAGAPMVARFFTERVFATPWRLDPLPVNGQPGLRAWQLVDGVWAPGAVAALSLRRGRISRVSSFLDPAVVEMFATDR